MKKSVLMLAAALPMMFAACGTEDPEEGFNLETTTLEINYEGNANIETNVKGCTFVSDNEFIASVDKDGKVTANHVGEAKITVAYEGESAVCKVTVKPTMTVYTMQVIDWKLNLTQVEDLVKADFPNLVKNDEVSSADALAYTTKGTFPIYAYAFNNNALAASTLMISTEMDDKDSLGEWLEQYYAYYNDTEMGMLYGNAKSIDDATVLVEFEGGMDDCMATWTANEPTKTVRGGMIIDRTHIEKSREIARKTAGK